LFLGIVGIVAIFFLFTREITRFVQFLVLAATIAVVFYTPSIVQGHRHSERAQSPKSGQFPVALAEAYAAEFGQVYLNFNPGAAAGGVQLMNELPAFFQAYANGDSAALNRFLAPGVRITGLVRTVAFDSMACLHVPPGGTTRQITVSVIRQLLSQGVASGAKLQVTYSMSVVQ